MSDTISKTVSTTLAPLLQATSPLLDPKQKQTEERQANTRTIPCGVGEYEAVWLGRADYLENGLERDWSFRDVVIVDGEVVGVSYLVLVLHP
jgi:hypothetical protein